MPVRRTYTQENVDAISRRFDAAPPDPAPARFSTSRLIQKLVPKIRAMNQNGYSWEAIAAMMADEGVTVSGSALRKCVAQSQDKKKTKKAQTQGKRADAPTPISAHESPAAAHQSVAGAAPRVERIGTDVEAVPARAPTVPPIKTPQPARPSLAHSPADAGTQTVAADGAPLPIARRSEFTIRPDNPNI